MIYKLHEFIVIFRKFAAATRVVFGRGSVESGLSETLTGKNSELKDLFEVKWMRFKRKIRKHKEDDNTAT